MEVEIETPYPRNYGQDETFSYKFPDFTLILNITMNVTIVHPRNNHAHSIKKHALGDTEEGKDVVMNQILPQQRFAVEGLQN